jgi:hypothetical protein
VSQVAEELVELVVRLQILIPIAEVVPAELAGRVVLVLTEELGLGGITLEIDDPFPGL